MKKQTKQAPKTIYLQIDGEWEGEKQITWCEDKINDDDIEYVRKDQIAKAQQEAVERVEALRKTDRFPQSLNTFDGKTKTFNRLSDADINYNEALNDVLEALQKEQE